MRDQRLETAPARAKIYAVKKSSKKPGLEDPGSAKSFEFAIERLKRIKIGLPLEGARVGQSQNDACCNDVAKACGSEESG